MPLRIETVAENLIAIGDWLPELADDLIPGTARRWAENDRRELAEDSITRLPLPPAAWCDCGRRMYRRPERETGPDGLPLFDGLLYYGSGTYCRVCDASPVVVGESRAPMQMQVLHVLDVEVLGNSGGPGRLLALEATVRHVLGDSMHPRPVVLRLLRRLDRYSQVRQPTLVRGDVGPWRYIDRGPDPAIQPGIDAARYLSRQLNRIARHPDLYTQVAEEARRIHLAILTAVGAAQRRRWLQGQRCPICDYTGVLVALIDDGTIICTANCRYPDGTYSTPCRCGDSTCGCHAGRRHEYPRCPNDRHPGGCCCGWERLGLVLETREEAS